MAKKYYVVWKGRKTGIFDNWNDCNQQINGFKGAEFISFPTRELAEKAFSKNYSDYKGKNTKNKTISKELLSLVGKPILNSISVDASSIGNPGIMEYQGVETETKNIIFKKGPFKDSTNNIGEFLAIVHALALMKKKGDTRPIYSDSKIAINWVKNKMINTFNPETKNNEKSRELIKRALIWLNENDYPNEILKWETKAWGEIPADFGRKR